MSLISGRRRSATIVAGANCVLIETPRRSMNRLINSVEAVKRDAFHICHDADPTFVRAVKIDRAHRYAPTHGRDELVAGLMVDALDQAADSGSREAALVHFVERVGADEAAALRRALAELESKTAADARSGKYTEVPPAGNPGTG